MRWWAMMPLSALVLLVMALAAGQEVSDRELYIPNNELVPEGAAGRYDLEFRMHRNP